MTYNPLIPIGEDSPANQAAKIRQNFSSLASVFSRTVAGSVYNHTPFNNFNQGDHETILFQKQSSDHGVSLNLDVLYAKDVVSASSTEPQLFVQIPQFVPNKTNSPMQLTFNVVNTVGPIYQSFLPGGYLLYFGTAPNNALPITLVPTPKEIIIVLAEPNSNAGFRDVSAIITNPDKITLYSGINTGAIPLSWLAIAKA